MEHPLAWAILFLSVLIIATSAAQAG